VIITGANTGIGKETAIDLAKRGGKIYIACRDLKRGQKALEEIRAKSGSENVHFMQLDLASLDSVRKFSQRLKIVFDPFQEILSYLIFLGLKKKKINYTF
jgi:NAD(P)-dependent dehydrogenase (short-subunit alcohol dehydrogenase family)